MNPELQRNLWIQLSPQRLIGMPLVVGLIMTLIVLIDERPVESIGNAALLICLVLSVWGAARAYRSVPEEIEERTWDFQRLSAQSPWALTWGKLLGSTVFAWYGVAFALPLFAVAAGLQGPLGAISKIVAFYLLGTVVLQAAALLIGVNAVRYNRAKGAAGRSSLLPIFLLCVFVPPLIMWPARYLDSKAHVPAVIYWHDLALPADVFVLASAALFAAWGLLGAYRLMRVELQFPAAPWVWLAFLLYTIVFVTGLIDAPHSLDAAPARAFAAFIIALSSVYLNALSEPKDVLVLRRLQHRGWRAMLGVTVDTPRWLVSLQLSVVLALLVQFFPGAGILTYASAGGAAIIGVLMCARDILLLLYIGIGPGGARRTDLAVLVTFALLYGLLPLFPGLHRIFYPWLFAHSSVGVLVALVWAAAAALLLQRRWRAAVRSLEAPQL